MYIKLLFNAQVTFCKCLSTIVNDFLHKNHAATFDANKVSVTLLIRIEIGNCMLIRGNLQLLPFFTF